ncbi:LysR family transcriptional regulator [Mitsuokella sp.]|uniref:LysR family transcriptional regulator n=1 Tax=Mitsuokella sp. TaxID=2049034 RepID=UPI003D7E3C30
MNTTQLECFATLANTLNYMRAAEELNMTQPAVSRQIQSLEQELGTQLFHRTTRAVSLTQVGAQFLPEAQSMLHTYYHSLDWISHFQNTFHQVLRIGYMDTQAMPLLTAFLRPVLEQQEKLTAEFTLDQTDANLQRLVSGKLDLVFTIKDAKFAHESVVFTPLHEERFYCVCRKDHPLAQKKKRKRDKSVSSEELLPYRQIFDIPPYLLKHVFSRGHRILPVNEEQDNIICANASEACALALCGSGYVLLPDYLLPAHKELAVFSWPESPVTQLGIYSLKTSLADKKSPIYQVIREARAYYEDMAAN